MIIVNILPTYDLKQTFFFYLSTYYDLSYGRSN